MPSDRATVNEGPRCPHCGLNDWELTPDADSKAVCRNCDYATDDPPLLLPDRCHGCGRKNDGDLYWKHEGQSNQDSAYYVCSHCSVGVRVPTDPDIVSNRGVLE